MVTDAFPASAETACRQQSLYDLVVVIVNWNVKELLAACLKSLPRASENLRVHTVVVDNGSSDGSVEMVLRDFPGVEVVASPENLGFSCANNLALRRYQNSARYCLLLNPDTVVEPGALDRMCEFMDSHPDAGIAGCKLVKPDGVLDWPCKRWYFLPSVLFYRALGLDRRFPKSRRFGQYHLTYLDENQIHQVAAVVGAFMMIRQQCLVAIGHLDESFFMYGEDVEWCYRAKDAGWNVYYVPTATVVHHKGQSTSKQSYRMIYHWYMGTWRVYAQYMAKRYPAVVNATVWAGLRTMLGASLVANFFRFKKRVPSRK